MRISEVHQWLWGGPPLLSVLPWHSLCLWQQWKEPDLQLRVGSRLQGVHIIVGRCAGWGKNASLIVVLAFAEAVLGEQWGQFLLQQQHQKPHSFPLLLHPLLLPPACGGWPPQLWIVGQANKPSTNTNHCQQRVAFSVSTKQVKCSEKKRSPLSRGGGST